MIIPVAGVYPGLKENLRSRLTQDYPQYQVIFATRSEDDPATGVIKTLLPDFPQARLVVCRSRLRLQPKKPQFIGRA